MTEDNLPFNVSYQSTQSPSGKTIAISISEDKFADFITILLGQPQNIRKDVRAIFQLDHAWFNNLHSLLMQRISRQNEFNLIQFSASIFFEDGLVRTLSSSEAFLSFAEVQPLISIGCKMTWTLLVCFKDKSAPEKQEIRIMVMSKQWTYNDELFEIFGPYGSDANGRITLEIDHTERTWGDDIIALMLAHVNSHVQSVGYIRRWMQNNAMKVCFLLSFASVFSIGWLAIELSRMKFDHFIEAKTGALDLTTISEKLDFLIRKPDSTDFYLVIIGCAIINVCLFILPKMIRAVPQSFVLFNDITRAHMAKKAKKNKWRRNIADTILIGIIVSLAASWIYSLLS